ncbi:hypothetical protein ACOMHN_046175 [Nucella lapillus]
MGSGHNTSLWLLILLGFVPGVRADATETALIATGCVIGVLVFSAVVGALVYCTIRRKNQELKLEKRGVGRGGGGGAIPGSTTLPALPPERLSNGTLQGGGGGGVRGGGHPDLPPFPPGPGLPFPRGNNIHNKAYTQHAAPSRHRPPLTFFTLRRDPRDFGFPAAHGMMPMGVRGGTGGRTPGGMGQPVLYLDMMDVLRPQGNGTVPRMANGTTGSLLITELDNGVDPASQEERYRKKESSKKSRGRPKSRSRPDSPNSGKKKDRSRSRSRDAVGIHSGEHRDSRSRHSSHPLEEPPILARPGDIILSESHPPEGTLPMNGLSSYSRRSYNNDMDTGSGGFVTTSMQQQRSSFRGQQDYETVERPPDYSLGDNTFDTPTADYNASNPTLPGSESAALREATSRGEDLEPEPTLRADYPPPAPLPPPPAPPLTSSMLRGRPTRDGRSSDADPEPTPRADYSGNRDSTIQSAAFNFTEAMQPYLPSLDKTMNTATNQSFEAILNSVDLDEGGSSQRRQQRPRTPPFDGEVSPRDSLYPPRNRSLRQTSPSGHVPTPPYDIPDQDGNGDSDTGEAQRTSLRAGRPPTPPPGKILKTGEPELAVLRDLYQEGAKAAAEQPQSPTAHLPALPFMAELRKRHGDPQEEETGQQQQVLLSQESMRQREDDILRGLDAVLSPEGLNASRSHVSFAADPPAIIPGPHDRHQGSSTSLPPDYDTDPPPPSSFAPPSPTPPPPPPLPPASRRF